MTANADAALGLWRRGFSVFAVPRGCKTPTRPWRDWQTRRPTEAEVRAMFAAPSNVAIVTGAVSGVVVVDADSDAAGRWCVRHLPYTAWQTRTPRGWHFYYVHPGVRVPNTRLDTRAGLVQVDVRADGGYVIGPGSVHPSGRLYTEAGDWREPRSALPRFWPGWLPRPGRRSVAPPPPPLPVPATDLHARARRYLAAIPRPEIGAGSDVAVLSAAARLVRGFGLAPDVAEALLWDWAGQRPGWTRAWVRQKVDNAVRYGTEAIGALIGARR